MGNGDDRDGISSGVSFQKVPEHSLTVSPAMCSPGTATSGELEFHSYDDDAWYNVEVKLEGDVLRIRYCEFPGENDNVFHAGDFRGFSDVNDLEARFRPMSKQLQDSECRKVDLGMPVCASYSSRDDDIRFYDALVDGHGPNSGNLTIASIPNMCQIQSGRTNDAVLATFFRKAREKIQTRLDKGDSCSEGRPPIYNGGTCQKDNCGPTLKHKLSPFQCMNQETRHAHHSSGMVEPCEDLQTLSLINSELIEQQDTDIGGMKYQYMILLENLEKGLSSVKLAKFLHRQTSILPQVHIFPSLSYQSYARGAVLLNCRQNLERLCGFLDNPDHVIISSQGRPLVVTGKVVRPDAYGTMVGATVLDTDNNFCNRNDRGLCRELKVVSQGTKEYLTGKKLKELFLEFLSHQRRLHQRLAMEESQIYCSDRLQMKL